MNAGPYVPDFRTSDPRRHSHLQI